MEENLFLNQKIEFLQLQLEDAKIREDQIKKMYESMLNSLKSETHESESEKKLIQLQCEKNIQIQMLENQYKDKIKSLENVTNALEIKINELNLDCFTLKKDSEEKIKRLNDEIQKLNENCRFLNEKNRELGIKLKENEFEMQEKEKSICKLNKEIEEISSKFNEEIIKAHEQGNEKLEELKKIYDIEKNLLKKQIESLQATLKSISPSDYFDLLISELDPSKIESTKHYLEQTLENFRVSIESVPTAINNQISHISELPIKQKFEITEKMLKFSEKVQENFACIKKSLMSLKRFVKSREEKDKNLKETLQKKNEEIDNLQRVISIRSADPSKKNEKKILDDLILKENEISNLKKIIGKMKESENLNKPPMHSRSKTLPNLASPLKSQSKNTYLILTPVPINDTFEKTEENNVVTTASSERVSEDKLEIYENKINSLKISMVKLKNQRDRAKNLSEKLLLELKQKKLDLALIQENSAEQNFSVLTEIKGLVNYISTLSTSALVPKCVKQDLQKLLNNYSQYI